MDRHAAAYSRYHAGPDVDDSTMFGIESVSSNGCPYPGGGEVEFTREDVAALGKLSVYGSQARTQFVVRLQDGRQVFVKACDQTKENEKWLRKIAKTFSARAASRDIGFALVWQNVDSPGHGGAGQTVGSEGSEVPRAGHEQVVDGEDQGPHQGAPGDRGTAIQGPPRRVAWGVSWRQCWHYFWPDGRVTSENVGPREPVPVDEETWWWALAKFEASIASTRHFVREVRARLFGGGGA